MEPAQKRFVDSLISWDLVRRRLDRYPAIRSAFPLDLLAQRRESEPYFCHYMAWRLGTWTNESVMSRLDDLLEAASRLPNWSSERGLLESAEFGDFWSLLWQLQVAEYLAGVRDTSMRTLADLIAFDLANCEAEMRFFGQEIFDLAEATGGDLTAPEYLDARALCLQLARDEGIDAALARDDLDAIVAPSFSFGSSPAAVAGYPDISIPVGINSEGVPTGIWMYGGRQSTARLIRLAFDLESEIRARKLPRFVGTIPPEPPNAGLCGRAAASSANRQAAGRGAQPAGEAAGGLAWLFAGAAVRCREHGFA